MASRTKTLIRLLAALVVAAAIWLPLLHLFYRPSRASLPAPTGLTAQARALAARHLKLWTDPSRRTAELKRMRLSNAEWDFMGRTFLALALANMALREPDRQGEYLQVIDHIIDETLRLERDKGVHHFLMDYSRNGRFLNKQTRSLFEDGEIALMLGARRLAAEKESYRPLLTERIKLMESYLRQSRVLSGESYPNECWMFCNTVALAAMRLAEHLDGTNTTAFRREWLAVARHKLLHHQTGLLISSYSVDGSPFDGPEGSSIWMAAHCLQIVDPAFAADQYWRARRELARNLLGFGYAREWPASWRSADDVDSGPVIPLLEASAGSSGLAILGAAAFGDTDYLQQLLTTLEFAAFPMWREGNLRYGASNQVGDAVLLYALVQGPLWAKVQAPR